MKQNQTLKIVTLLAASVIVAGSVVAQTTKYVENNAISPLKSYAVSGDSHPFFVDIDGDGDLDCFSGEFNYNGKGTSVSSIHFFRNEGTNAYPLFKKVAENENPLGMVKVSGLANPVFVDIDNDGLVDCFIGSTGGIVYFYKNIGTVNDPKFEIQSPSQNPLHTVRYANFDFVNAAFADIDNDGDLDCLITDAAGNEAYYINAGTKERPLFEKVAANQDPFRFLANTQIKGVSFFDWNKDGLVDLFVGNKMYKNIGSKTNPVFQPVKDDSPELIAYASELPVRWVDLNHDGRPEAVRGNENGTFDYLTVKNVSERMVMKVDAYPNPSKEQFTIYLPNKSTASVFVKVTDASGKTVLNFKTDDNTIVFGKNLKPGSYFLQVNTNNEVATQKLIKQ